MREIERYIAWPAQASAYEIGQLRIVALRDQVVLRNGALPLTLLERAVEDRVSAQRGTSPPSRAQRG